MFSSANLGHCHPYVREKVMEQMNKIVMANLSTHNATYGPFAKTMCERFGYDKIIAMTSGTEAADTACKIARKWGIQVKGISEESCIILGVGSSYHGLGSSVWGLMDSTRHRKEYGLDSKMVMNVNPSTRELLEYLDLQAMRRCLEEHSARISAVIMECLHGTSQSVEDEITYVKGVHDLCREHNVLFIADEVRQGVGKTGKFLGYDNIGQGFQPDITTMGKIYN
jgi:ornithine--oxo-acid transaminase